MLNFPLLVTEREEKAEPRMAAAETLSDVLFVIALPTCFLIQPYRVTILVNRGFVSRKKVKPETRLKGQVRRVDGIIMGWFGHKWCIEVWRG